ncbi:MAG TPA: DUF4328 domain-containing protein [Flavobacteriales bacterium]|nr:DUF4328 domain-containing protein [Flavobacteriales bacterium]
MENLDSNSLEKQPILEIKTKWNLLAIFVILTLLSQVVVILRSVDILKLVDRVNNGDQGAAYILDRTEREITPLMGISGLVGIAAIVFVCMWFYRAHLNNHYAGINYLKYSPGWCVGWFFIPFVQLVMPFLTTREIWKASASINSPQEHTSWLGNKVSPWISVWYFSFLTSLVVSIGIGFSDFDAALRYTTDADAALRYYRLQAYSQLAQIPFHTLSGIALIIFSKKITDTQEQYRAS